MMKVLSVVSALLLSLAAYLMASGGVGSFLVLERSTQWLIFLSMGGIAILLWIRLFVIWRRRAAAMSET